MKKTVIAFVLMACTWAASAHPGHGHDNPLSPGHYAGNLEHALPLALAVVAATALIGWGLFRWNRHLAKLRNRK
jgi:hypothetical protein